MTDPDDSRIRAKIDMAFEDNDVSEATRDAALRWVRGDQLTDADVANLRGFDALTYMFLVVARGIHRPDPVAQHLTRVGLWQYVNSVIQSFLRSRTFSRSAHDDHAMERITVLASANVNAFVLNLSEELDDAFESEVAESYAFVFRPYGMYNMAFLFDVASAICAALSGALSDLKSNSTVQLRVDDDDDGAWRVTFTAGRVPNYENTKSVLVRMLNTLDACMKIIKKYIYADPDITDEVTGRRHVDVRLVSGVLEQLYEIGTNLVHADNEHSARIILHRITEFIVIIGRSDAEIRLLPPRPGAPEPAAPAIPSHAYDVARRDRNRLSNFRATFMMIGADAFADMVGHRRTARLRDLYALRVTYGTRTGIPDLDRVGREPVPRRAPMPQGRLRYANRHSRLAFGPGAPPPGRMRPPHWRPLPGTAQEPSVMPADAAAPARPIADDDVREPEEYADDDDVQEPVEYADDGDDPDDYVFMHNPRPRQRRKRFRCAACRAATLAPLACGAGCGTLYCSRACARRHWPDHASSTGCH